MPNKTQVGHLVLLFIGVQQNHGDSFSSLHVLRPELVCCFFLCMKVDVPQKLESLPLKLFLNKTHSGIFT